MKALYFNKSYNSKKTHKIMLVFLMLATIFTCLFSLSYNKTINASTRIIDDTLTPIYTFSGGGTSSNPYLISSSTDLKNLATNVNNGTTYSGKYFAMTTNIDLGGQKFTPIGKNYSYAFKGIFDGNGYTISNIYINETSNPAGIFGYVISATISNLKISNRTITQTGASQCAGGIVGWVNGSSKIEKCTNDGVKVITKSDSGNTEAGGIVGYINGSSFQITTITWCSNYADVNNDSYSTGVTSAGGIAGRQDKYNYTNISLCKNFGNIYCGTYVYNPIDRTKNLKSASKPRAGGIIGSHNKGTITKSFNNGDVTSGIAYNIVNRYGYYSTDTYGSDIYKGYGATLSYAGGIAGYSNGSSITYCFNKGVITAKAKSDKQEYKFLLSGVYTKDNGTTFYKRNDSNSYDSVFDTKNLDPETYNGIVYGTKFLGGYTRSLHADRHDCYYFKDLKDKSYQHKYTYNIRAYSYGIAYTTNSNVISYCYNDSTVKGGYALKEIVFTLRCFASMNSYSNVIKFEFSFNSGGRYGPISNNTQDNNYYSGDYSNVEKFYYYTVDSGDKNTFSASNGYNKEHTMVVKNKTQYFSVEKSADSNDVKFFIANEKHEGKVNIISHCGFGYEIFKGKDYVTFDETYSLWGTASNDLTKIFSSISVWAQSDIINGGTPYIKEMYWEGCASES